MVYHEVCSTCGGLRSVSSEKDCPACGGEGLVPVFAVHRGPILIEYRPHLFESSSGNPDQFSGDSR
jgi:hypothetical protein